MPTVSEPVWPEKDQRTARYVDEFVNGTDSVDVLKARLIGNGERGQELEALVSVAIKRRVLLHARPMPLTRVEVLGKDGSRVTLRFMSPFYAGEAVRMLRRTPGVLFASRVN